MVSASLERLLDQKLADPSFIEFNNSGGFLGLGGRAVSDETIQAIRQGLLDLPEPALKDFLESKVLISVGDDAYYKRLFQQHGDHWTSPLGQNIRAENAKMFGGRPALIIRSDIPANEARMVARHEIGHALDHINNNYRGYRSVDSPVFRRAVDSYMEQKQHAPATRVMFDTDGSFRDFIKLYGVKDGNVNNSLYKEFSAEMFNKYSAISEKHGAAAADKFMSRNYLEAWDAYKTEVAPQIGADVNAAHAAKASNQTRASFDPETEKILQSNKWQKATTEGGAKIIRMPVGDLKPDELAELEKALRAQGIEPIRVESATLGPTLRIAGEDVDRFEQIRDSGARFTPPPTTDDLLRSRGWQAAETTDGTKITRLPTGDLSPDQVAEMEKALRAQGIEPIRVDSATLGPTLRIAGEDVDRFEQIQKSGIPQETEPPTRVVASPPEVDAPKAPPPDIDMPKAGSGFFGKMAEGLGDLGKRAGVIGGAAIGVVAGGAALLGGASKAEAAQVVAESAVPYGETGFDLAEGDMEAAQKSATVETASNAASIGGAVAGAVIGQVLIPIPGVGAAIGGFVGSMVAGVATGVVTEAVVDHAKAPEGDNRSFWSRLNPFSDDDDQKPTQVAKNEPENTKTPQTALTAEEIAQARALEQQLNGADNSAQSRTMEARADDAYTAEPAIARSDDLYVSEPAIARSDDVYESVTLENTIESWDENLVTTYFAPETLENKSCGGAFGNACGADVKTMQAVYKPEPGSTEHLEFAQMVDRKSLDDQQDDPEIQRYAKLNDTVTLG